jgi:hypothetical protein
VGQAFSPARFFRAVAVRERSNIRVFTQTREGVLVFLVGQPPRNDQ